MCDNSSVTCSYTFSASARHADVWVLFAIWTCLDQHRAQEMAQNVQHADQWAYHQTEADAVYMCLHAMQ